MRCRILALAATIVAIASAPAADEPAQDKQGQNLKVDIPIAIGQSVKGIRFPHYDKDKGGRLALRFNAESAERASEKIFTFKSLRIEVFDEQADKAAMEIVLSEAAFDRDTEMLISHEQAKIKGQQFEITGSQMEFNSKTRTSKLTGPVFMTVRDAEGAVAR